jgi:hypothetical protein
VDGLHAETLTSMVGPGFDDFKTKNIFWRAQKFSELDALCVSFLNIADDYVGRKDALKNQ